MKIANNRVKVCVHPELTKKYCETAYSSQPIDEDNMGWYGQNVVEVLQLPSAIIKGGRDVLKHYPFKVGDFVVASVSLESFRIFYIDTDSLIHTVEEA